MFFYWQRYRQLARLPRASVLLPEAGSLSLACPRESNQREGHPHLAPAGLSARQVREGRPGFSTGLPAPAKRDRRPADPPAGLIVHPSPPHRGPEHQKLQARAVARHIAVAFRVSPACGAPLFTVGAHPVRDRRRSVRARLSLVQTLLQSARAAVLRIVLPLMYCSMRRQVAWRMLFCRSALARDRPASSLPLRSLFAQRALLYRWLGNGKASATPHPDPLPGGQRAMWFVAKSERTGGAGRSSAVMRDAIR
jgi:hypothetical protein